MLLSFLFHDGAKRIDLRKFCRVFWVRHEQIAYRKLIRAALSCCQAVIARVLRGLFRAALSCCQAVIARVS